MSDEARNDQSAPPPTASHENRAPASEPPMTRAERIFVRINIVQTILAVAGVFTGAVALYAALNESAAVRRQAEAAVWPIIQLHTSDFMSEESAGFTVSMRNTGVGPGRMESMRVRIGGDAARDWIHAIELAGGDPSINMSKSSVANRVIAAGETVNLFAVSDRNLVAAMTELAATGDAQIDYCYCSIFDACWSFETVIAKAQQVKVCPDFGAEQFQD